MTMPIEEEALRHALQTGLDGVPVPGTEFEPVRRAGRRRHRRRQAVGSVVALGVTAAVVVGVVGAVGAGPQRLGQTVPAAQLLTEQRQQLRSAAHVAGARSFQGPVTDAAGTWGFYATAKGPRSSPMSELPSAIHVLRWSADGWQSTSVVRMREGTGAVVALHKGAEIAGDGVSVQVQFPGGDNVPGGELVRIHGAWQLAGFDECNEAPGGVCATPEPHRTIFPETYDGYVKDGVFRSDYDTGNPSMAAGTMYLITWRWDPSRELFVVAARQRVGPGGTTPSAPPSTVPASTPPASSTTSSYPCPDNDPSRDLTVTSVSQAAGGTFSVTGHPTDLVCGVPDDVAFVAESGSETIQLASTVVVLIAQDSGQDRTIPTDRLATYVAGTPESDVFTVTGPLTGVTKLAERFHP